MQRGIGLSEVSCFLACLLYTSFQASHCATNRCLSVGLLTEVGRSQPFARICRRYIVCLFSGVVEVREGGRGSGAQRRNVRDSHLATVCSFSLPRVRHKKGKNKKKEKGGRQAGQEKE